MIGRGEEIDVPIVFKFIRKLIFEFLSPDTRSSSSITQRVSSLDHELGNNTMEDNTLEIPAARVSNKVLHSFGCLLGEQPDVDIAFGGVDRSGVGYVGGPCGCVGDGGCHSLFFSTWSLVEDVTIASSVDESL